MTSKPALALVVLGLGFAVWLGASLCWLLYAPPLGHDESQYAIAFGDLVSGHPLRWIYLSRGMNALAAPGVWLGGGEIALRIAPLVFGVVFLATVARLAWRLFGATTAAFATALLATSAPLVRRSAELLSDFPSAALLLAAALLLVEELVRAPTAPGARGGAGWRLVWVAPLVAAAFYVRYGSCVPAAILGVVTGLAGAGALRRRPAPALAAAALLAILLVPHLWDSTSLLGSPLAILRESRMVPRSEVSGLRTYLTNNPLGFYGHLLAPVLALAALGTPAVAWRWWRRGTPELALRARRALVLWGIAVIDVIAIGLTAVGQLRYILLGVALLAVLGVELLRVVAAGVSISARRWGGAALALALAAGLLTSVVAVARHGRSRRHALRDVLDTSAVIARDARGRRCHFVAGHYTQIEWYSRCDGDYFSLPQALARDEAVYFVTDPSWQPSPEEAALPHVVVLERPQLKVVRVTGTAVASGAAASGAAAR